MTLTTAHLPAETEEGDMNAATDGGGEAPRNPADDTGRGMTNEDRGTGEEGEAGREPLSSQTKTVTPTFDAYIAGKRRTRPTTA